MSTARNLRKCGNISSTPNDWLAWEVRLAIGNVGNAADIC